MLRLRKCKKHLKAQTMPVHVHVENDSRKSSGYSATVNRGLRHWLDRCSEWNYIVVCDQDMYLDPNAIENLYVHLESHPKCGIAVCLQRIEDRPMFVHGGGIDCYPVGSQLQLHISYYEKEAKPVWWGDIACMMVRKECMWDIGLLDENFRYICSDSDYTLTARSKGWEIWTPYAAGIHIRGGSHPKSYEGKSQNQIMKDPLVHQMKRDQEMFKKKWLDSGYYKILKYEDDKPIFIIRSGVILPCDGQGDAIDELKEKWLKEKRQQDKKEKAEFVPQPDAATKRIRNFARAVGG
ncbi:MAG: glycosyltransferase family 2 protein [Planctomycetota bacterium]